MPALTAADRRDEATPRSRRFRADGAHPSPAADYDAFAESLRAELAPAGPIEEALAGRVICAAWRLDRAAKGARMSQAEARAERSLFGALASLGRLRDARPGTWGKATPVVAPVPAEDSIVLDDDRPWLFVRDDEPRETVDAADPSLLWRDRLELDPNVSEVSPVVRGTWVTVRHVVSLVVDGWNWADILRDHPELTEADVRACMAYAVEEEGSPFTA